MGWRRDRGFVRDVDRQGYHAPDWKDAAAYAPLLEADRSILAWEWLRRDPGYRAAAMTARDAADTGRILPRPEHWGLHAFEGPDVAAPSARPVWRADIHDLVLPAAAAAARSPTDAFDLDRFGGLVTLIRSGSGSEHLLLSDGLRAVRVDVLAGRVSEGPAELRYLLAGIAAAEGPLLAVRRLLALCRTGGFSRSLHAAEAKARRWLLMLRAHDAVAAGAGQREIAAVLLSRSADEPRWRSQTPSLRSQSQRLVRRARMMAAGGYRALLQS